VKPTSVLAVVLIVAGAVAAWRPPAHRPEPNGHVPDAATRAAVANVREILANHQEDGQQIAAFYRALADVVERDAGQVLRDVADVREANRRAGLLMFQRTGVQGKYPGLSDAIESALAELVGLDNVPLDEAKRKNVVAAFRALAWACGDA
jgi:hypothetical protein